jgi:hypothetical protein
MLPHIGLVADHLSIIWDTAAANLNSGVGMAGITQQPDSETKFEIPVLILCAKKHIFRNLTLERTRYDSPILDAKPVEISLPASKGLAIEDGSKAFFYFHIALQA